MDKLLHHIETSNVREVVVCAHRSLTQIPHGSEPHIHRRISDAMLALVEEKVNSCQCETCLDDIVKTVGYIRLCLRALGHTKRRWATVVLEALLWDICCSKAAIFKIVVSQLELVWRAKSNPKTIFANVISRLPELKAKLDAVLVCAAWFTSWSCCDLKKTGAS